MLHYDANSPPDPSDWLQNNEFHRIQQVEDYHQTLDEPHPAIPADKAHLHATSHVLVENRLLEHDHLTTSTLSRLMRQGLTRHEAIHAIGSILVDEVFEILESGNSKKASQHCHHRLEKLTADKWRQGHA